METPSEFIKAITRPFLTIAGLIVWTAMIMAEVEYPPEFSYAVLGMLGFWFGERLLGKVNYTK